MKYILLLSIVEANKLDTLTSDMGICVQNVLTKYDLSDAVAETRQTASDPGWLKAVRDAEEPQAKAMLGETLDPISQQLLGADGSELVEKMPKEVVSWFIDSAVLAGVNEGTIESKCTSRCPEPEVREVEVIQEVPVEKVVERIIYVEK